MYSDTPERNFAGTILFFVVTALTAYILLVAALVCWLAEVLGSWPLAALLTGGLALLLAATAYLLAVREALARMRERWSVIFEVLHSCGVCCGSGLQRRRTIARPDPKWIRPLFSSRADPAAPRLRSAVLHAPIRPDFPRLSPGKRSAGRQRNR